MMDESGDSRRRAARQYDLMRDRLDGFRKGVVGLGRLISDLEALADQVETADKSWNDDFRARVGDLEMIYAVTFGAPGPALPPVRTTDLARHVGDLEKMLIDPPTNR
ncbi:hypothetical protein [Actinokineospora sp. NBRC 105648]|uniref:hypothetical protein n=1 Tax=Actinokineospora sp. NBRC 105648 TaxID=3032206 RepID=UPI0024A48B06|nr:hypothetical protein [Actinokineospora sp. NBRC 105648]GLZ42892.1 hypothetical protein Acsp05_65160 [Actinokineospora sp. NBRC 105648]